MHVVMMVWCFLSVFSNDITLKYNVSCEFCSGIGDCIQTDTETTCKCPYPYFGKKLPWHSYLDFYLSNKTFCVTCKMFLVIVTLDCAIWICTGYLYIYWVWTIFILWFRSKVWEERPLFSRPLWYQWEMCAIGKYDKDMSARSDKVISSG